MKINVNKHTEIQRLMKKQNRKKNQYEKKKWK